MQSIQCLRNELEEKTLHCDTLINEKSESVRKSKLIAKNLTPLLPNRRLLLLGDHFLSDLRGWSFKRGTTNCIDMMLVLL